MEIKIALCLETLHNNITSPICPSNPLHPHVAPFLMEIDADVKHLIYES